MGDCEKLRRVEGDRKSRTHRIGAFFAEDGVELEDEAPRASEDPDPRFIANAVVGVRIGSTEAKNRSDGSPLRALQHGQSAQRLPTMTPALAGRICRAVEAQNGKWKRL